MLSVLSELSVLYVLSVLSVLSVLNQTIERPNKQPGDYRAFPEFGNQWFDLEFGNSQGGDIQHAYNIHMDGHCEY